MLTYYNDDGIAVIDDLMPVEEAERFNHIFFEDKSWIAGWNRGLSDKNVNKWNWHRSVGNDVQNLYTESVDLSILPDEISNLWYYVEEAITEHFSVKHYMTRYYSNSHTYGVDGSIHTDDGDVTALYYPCMDWDAEWEGGTSFYNKEKDDCIHYSSYKFNRLILFKAKIPHRAMPVTRECYQLRTSVVFKTKMDINDPTYAEWYRRRNG